MKGYGQKKRARRLAPWKVKLAHKLSWIIMAAFWGGVLGGLITWTVRFSK